MQAGEHQPDDEACLVDPTQTPRPAGPSNNNTTPLTNTIVVESTTTGAITRIGSSGGPLRR